MPHRQLRAIALNRYAIVAGGARAERYPEGRDCGLRGEAPCLEDRVVVHLIQHVRDAPRLIGYKPQRHTEETVRLHQRQIQKADAFSCEGTTIILTRRSKQFSAQQAGTVEVLYNQFALC